VHVGHKRSVTLCHNKQVLAQRCQAPGQVQQVELLQQVKQGSQGKLAQV